MHRALKRLSVCFCFLCLVTPPSSRACLQGGQAEALQETAKNEWQAARELVALATKAPPGKTTPYVTDPTLTLSARHEAEGLHHVLAGRPDLAVQSFIAAENAEPGRYSVAANLGTAHELNGQNQAALRWIREAIARNPRSHDGTEWVHVAILEAKVRHGRTPGAPFTSLIPLPKEFSEDTRVAVLGVGRRVSDIKRAIGYQLGERLKFVKPYDPYVADLLFTLSVIDGRLYGFYGAGSAYEYARLAERYGYPDHAAIHAIRNKNFPFVILTRLWALAAPVLRLFAIAGLVYLGFKALCRCLGYFGWYPGSRRSADPAGTAEGGGT